MERRKFVKTLSWAMASGMALGARSLFGAAPVLPGVPQPPGPPKPKPAANVIPDHDPSNRYEPPFAPEVPILPFDAPPGSWTLVVMPDTQDMSDAVPDEYTRQTEWIVAHRESHNIIFIVHEGDLVNTNGSAFQWTNAQTSMRVLTKAGIPYSLLPGNHDLEARAEDPRYTWLNRYFTPDDYRHSEAFGLFEQGKMENSWHEFTAATGKYLIVAMEFAPRNAAVEWADQVVAAKPDRKVIIAAHSHLDSRSTRFDWAAKGLAQAYSPHSYRYGDVNDGEEVWNKFIKKHRNIFLVLCGHELGNGTGYLISEGDHGQRVHQVLANYQAAVEPYRPYCGGGYLRLMQFHPNGKTIQVKSYSPWLNQWLTTPDQHFTITV